MNLTYVFLSLIFWLVGVLVAWAVIARIAHTIKKGHHQ